MSLSICITLPLVTELKPLRDRVLVEQAQAGDKAALGELLRTHGPALYRSVLLPRLGSEAAAKDALSETYMKVIVSIGTFRWQDRGVYPWLRMIALRVALDALRARKRTLVWTEEDLEGEINRAEAETESALDEAVGERRDREVVREKIAKALADLHPRYEVAIRRRILDEAPREAVATELGVTPATFDVVLHRAVQALRKALEGKGSS